MQILRYFFRYLQFTERASKTRKTLSDIPRMFQPNMFEVRGKKVIFMVQTLLNVSKTTYWNNKIFVHKMIKNCRIFTDDPNCTVELYILYKQKRTNLTTDSKFYLGLNNNVKTEQSPWYINAPIGKIPLEHWLAL